MASARCHQLFSDLDGEAQPVDLIWRQLIDALTESLEQLEPLNPVPVDSSLSVEDLTPLFI